MLKKLVAMLSFLFLGLTVNADYTEVDCSTDSGFSEYSCNQCFAGDDLSTDNVYGLFSDTWINDSDTDYILYKVEQNMPTFVSLSSDTSYVSEPEGDNFWEYPEDIDNLYDENEEGYVLGAGESVKWISSSNGAGIKYTSLPDVGENASMLMFDTTVHPIIDGTPDLNSSQSHRECILYKSNEELVGTKIEDVITQDYVDNSDSEEKINEPEEIKITKFEDTKAVTEVESGPTGILIFILIALMLSLMFLNRGLVLEKIKK